MRTLLLTGLLLTASATAQSEPLSGDRVADYIETRIATHRLQMDLKANADQSDDVVPAFYRQREAMLGERGWTVSAFEAIQGRIMAAFSAMDRAQALEVQHGQDDKTIESMRAAGYVPDDKLQKMEQTMVEMRTRQREGIDATRPDWPAVEQYRAELEQLTDWIAGNTAQPPAL